MIDYFGLYQTQMAKVKIFYGTVGGNTQIVCEKVMEILEENGHDVGMTNARFVLSEAYKSLDMVQLFNCDLIIFASPTYGQGQLEPYFEKFIASLKNVDLKAKKYACISLGDIKYHSEYLLESANVIEDFCKEAGMEALIPPLKVIKSPLNVLDTAVKAWAEKLNEELKK